MTAENVLIGILGGGNLILFVKFLIERHDKKKEKEDDEIKEKLTTLEKDGLRTQLLFMLLMQPEEQTEILKIAEHYFVKLQGDWYMTSLFAKWCDRHNLEPEWFNRKE